MTARPALFWRWASSTAGWRTRSCAAGIQNGQLLTPVESVAIRNPYSQRSNSTSVGNEKYGEALGRDDQSDGSQKSQATTQTTNKTSTPDRSNRTNNEVIPDMETTSTPPTQKHQKTPPTDDSDKKRAARLTNLQAITLSFGTNKHSPRGSSPRRPTPTDRSKHIREGGPAQGKLGSSRRS